MADQQKPSGVERSSGMERECPEGLKKNGSSQQIASSGSGFTSHPEVQWVKEGEDAERSGVKAECEGDGAMSPTNGRCTCDWSRDAARRWAINNAVVLATVVAVILGVALGLGLRPLHLSYDAIAWISIWGELFLRMLKLIIIPLVMACLVVGVSSMESSASGRLGILTLVYIFVTTLIGVGIGLVLVVVIRPGDGFGDKPPEGATLADTSYTDIFTDLFRNLIPENIVQACLQSAYTDVKREVQEIQGVNGSDFNITLTSLTITRKLMYRDRMNTIGVVVFSLALGGAINASDRAGRPLLVVFQSLHTVIFTLMKVIIWYSPVGLLSLVATAFLRVDDIETAMRSMGLYVATISAGLMIHQLVVLPLLYLITVRKNPFKLIAGTLDAYFAALAPATAVPALPILLRNLPMKFGVDERVSNFFLPVSVALNRDGSALFISVASVFVAQSYGMALGAGQIIVLGLLVSILVAAVGAVPSGSVVVIIMVTSAVGIPVEERLGLIMAVEWIVDRLRTGTNVCGHFFGCPIVESFCRSQLRKTAILSDPDSPLDQTEEKDGFDQELTVVVEENRLLTGSDVNGSASGGQTKTHL